MVEILSFDDLPHEIPESDSERAYAYRGIPYYSGRVLKCQGIATRANAAHLSDVRQRDYTSNFVILRGYQGDRINASDFSPFKG